ncbi:MAG: hypothetical protein IPK99_13485 [Flavobacteriales bacterium]|nr:hypothetical protein [Flavobacteriales bacterium]
MNKHWYTSIILATVEMATASAQVISDFEDGNIDQWLVEADGVPSLDTVNGLPGNCLRITDQAVGVINQLVAPLAYTGDWSAATTSDSIAFDILNHRSNGSYLAFADGMIVLSGPGGTASTAAVFTPVQDTWLHEAYALDTSSWTIESGTWEGLLLDIQYVRIRTEFVSGGEYTLIDNVTLTFEPFIEPVQGTICSTWDTIGNLDGWSFQNVGSIQVSMTQGNPPGSVRMGDGSGALTYAVAAPRIPG